MIAMVPEKKNALGAGGVVVKSVRIVMELEMRNAPLVMVEDMSNVLGVGEMVLIPGEILVPDVMEEDV